MQNLPDDMVTYIMAALPYNSCQNMNDALSIQLSSKEIFKMFVSENKGFTTVLRNLGVNIDEFYEKMTYSTFDAHTICDLIFYIGNNKIDNENKYTFDFKYSIQTSNELIMNSIFCTKVLLNMIHKYITGAFIINNPYYYLHTSISNVLFNYLIYSLQIMKNISNLSNDVVKFRIMVLHSEWYMSTINMYHMLMAYLIRREIINCVEDCITDEQIFESIIGKGYAMDAVTCKCFLEFNELLQLKIFPL